MEKLDVWAFSAFDWLLILVIAISAVAAFRRGLIRVLFSLAGLVAGIVVASWTYLELGAEFTRYHAGALAGNVLAFVLIFVAVNLLFWLVGMLLSKTAAAVGLGFFDRLLGAGFGVLRGALVGVVVLIVFAAFAPDSDWIRTSQLAPYFLAGTHAVSFGVPDSFREQVTAGTHRLLSAQPLAAETVGENRPRRRRAPGATKGK